MLTQMLLYLILILCAFSIAVITERKFEEIIPFVFLGIVYIIFLSGMIGNLMIGFYSVLFVTGAAICLAAALCYRKKRKFLIKQNMLTPAFIIFTVLYIFLIPFNMGRVSYNWDEFSCWNSVVKIMTLWNQFGTVKEAKLLAAVYPPGMACFQYFIEKLHMLIGHAEFSEGILFFGYQIFSYALLFPFLKNLRYKNIGKIMLCSGILFAAPSFFPHFFVYLNIDTFLGTLCGVGLAMAFFWSETDAYYKTYLSFICCMLVLSKQAGLFFAILVAVSFMSRMFFAKKSNVDFKWFSFLKYLILISGSILIPYILWNMHVKKSECYVILTTPIDYRGFMQILLGKGDPKKVEILKAFLAILGKPEFGFNYGLTASLPYVVIVIVSMLYIVGNRLFEVRTREESHAPYLKMRVVSLIILTGFALYMAGLMFTYLYKIPDIRIPSFTRYTYIYLHSMIICFILCLLFVLQESDTYRKRDILLSLMVLILFPQEPLKDFLTYKEQTYALSQRAKYTAFINRCREAWGGEAQDIFLLIQEGNDDTYWHLYYSLLPSVIHNNANFPGESWMISSDERDISELAAIDITVDELRSELLEKYDIFLIWTADDYFREEFASLFSNPDDIADRSIYIINKKTGFLELARGE